MVVSEQYDLGECKQYLKIIWPLFQEQSVKEAIAVLLGLAGKNKNSFTYNQLLVLSHIVLLKTAADNFEEAWFIIEKYLENKGV